MRSFADLDALIGLVPAQVVTRLSAIDFGRGSEALFRDQMPGLLTELANRARVLSITASSAIEGVIVADADPADHRPAHDSTAQPQRAGTGRLPRRPGLPVPGGLAPAERGLDLAPAPAAVHSHSDARRGIQDAGQPGR